MESNWTFDLSDDLEAMEMLTAKIFAVVDRLFTEKGDDPLVAVAFDYVIEARQKAAQMEKSYCQKLIHFKDGGG